jgi:hypothetical protein
VITKNSIGAIKQFANKLNLRAIKLARATLAYVHAI